MTDPLEFNFTEFDEYIRQEEPNKKEKASIWNMAIGLQQVDQLKTSSYLHEVAKRNIEGEISMKEVVRLVNRYYESKQVREKQDDDTHEADRVAANIATILTSKTFNFSSFGFASIHRRVFGGIMKHAGEFRQFDITKKEWVLRGDSVLYLNWEDLRQAIDYDLAQEKLFRYKDLTPDEMVAHFSQFIANLWQIHPFREGNTRTTAVFAIQYLRSLGYDVSNDPFAKHSWYFRNALVRANYQNVKLGIEYTPIYLERFFRNLLLGESWDLRSRYLYIVPPKEWSKQPQLIGKSTNSSQKSSQKTENSSQKTGSGSQKSSQKIIELIRANAKITTQQMAEDLGISRRAVAKQIARLQTLSIIRRVGPDKGGYWEVED